MTSGTEEGWIVRGGAGCSSTAEAAGSDLSPTRIGLCCERAPAISSTQRGESWLKTANTYIGIVEDALNSTSPQKVVKLLADPAKLFTTRMTHEEALADLRGDATRFAEWNHRLMACHADVGAEAGSFECDTVEPRVPKDKPGELSVFRMRFEYGTPKLTYSVFADPVRVMRKWGPYGRAEGAGKASGAIDVVVHRFRLADVTHEQ